MNRTIRILAAALVAGASALSFHAQAAADDKEALAGVEDMKKSAGVDSIEQCSVAIRGQGTKAENVIPAVKVVGNGWISLVAYQSRGYAYIAP